MRGADNLDVIEVDGLGAHRERQLVPVACRALVVGRGVLEQVGPVLREQRRELQNDSSQVRMPVLTGRADFIGKEFKFKNNLSRRFWPL